MVFSSEEIVAAKIINTKYGYEVSIRLTTGARELVTDELKSEAMAKDILSKIVLSMRNPKSSDCDVYIDDTQLGVRLVNKDDIFS